MKYLDEFRDRELVATLLRTIAAEVDPERRYRVMEFCGGHTHAIFRYGLPALLPDNIQLIHGPGCPVCVLPIPQLDKAIALARRPEVILCSYGDMLRVPGSRRQSLLKAKAAGADVRMLYSCQDALAIAQQNPERQVVFFAIGFETTTPPTAATLLQADKLGLENFMMFCNHLLTPPAMQSILDSPGEAAQPTIEGFIGPGHVSTIIGSRPYEFVARDYQRPVVIAGFEPLDLLQAILMLVRQLNEGRSEVENQFSRGVSREGNRKAQDLMDQVFEPRPQFEWRGLGVLPLSALQIRPRYGRFDAEQRFDLETNSTAEVQSCLCGEVLRGQKRPTDCSLFADACTPENPIGACMVSSEGTCAAYYAYGEQR